MACVYCSLGVPCGIHGDGSHGARLCHYPGCKQACVKGKILCRKHVPEVAD